MTEPLAGPPHDSPARPYAPPAQRASAELTSAPSTPVAAPPSTKFGDSSTGFGDSSRFPMPAYRGPARPLSPAAQPYGPRTADSRGAPAAPYGWPTAPDDYPTFPVYGAVYDSAGHAYGPATAVPDDAAAAARGVPQGSSARSAASVPGTAVMPYVAPQPPSMRVAVQLVGPGGRLGAALLDLILVVLTLGIGWLVWAVVIWSKGQSPAKQLLGHAVADARTGAAFSFDRMLVRGLLFLLLNIVTVGVFGIVDCCFVFSSGHRTLHDRMAGSVVRYR